MSKGSFTEELVNQTISWYLHQDIAFFRKAHLPTSVNYKASANKCHVSLMQKADVDYYGVYRGQYISFEVKETNKDFFLLSQIKPHQQEILFKIEEYGAVSFLLLNFANTPDYAWLIKTSKLRELISLKKKRITIKEVGSLGTHIPVSFPGILDWIRALGLFN